MHENGFWGNVRLSGINVGMIVRLALALLTTFGSVALAWTLLNPHENAQATGIVEAATATYPWGLAQDGTHIWVAEPGCNLTPTCSTVTQGTIGKYFIAHPTYGKVDFPEPSGYSSPAFVALDGHGNIWFTEPTTDAIGELTPTGSGLWQQWNTGITPGSAPFDLTFDSNGNIWFTEANGNNIGFFNTTNDTVVETPVPTTNSQPYGISKAPNGTIWFTESNARKLGTFTPTTNGMITISEHSIGLVRSHLLTFDQSGNVWYSEGHADAVGEYTPTTKKSQNFSILSSLCPTPGSTATPTTCGTNTFIAGIGIDSNGMVWFDETNTGSVGFVNPTNGLVTVITTVAGAFDGLIIDGSNNVWVSKLPHRLVEIPSGTPPTTPTPTVASTSTVTPAPSATHTPSPTPCPSPSPSPTASPSATVTVSPTASPSPTVIPSPCPSPSPSPSPTSTPPPTTTGPVSKTWYFAEGKVGGGFTEFLTLENPDTINGCAVNIEYLLGTGNPVNVLVAVAPATRFTESVNTDLNTPASSGNYQTDSAVVTVNSSLSPNCSGIVAERPMYFTNFIGISSGSDVLGSTHTGTTFYFADVPTGGGYASFLTILNPGTTTAVVTATFVVGGATISSQTQTISVAGGTRGTIIPNNSGALLHAAVTVTSNQPVVVERPTYYSNVNGGNAQTVSGATSVVGVRTLKNDWLFAEGYTGGSFQEYFVLANFGTTAINVNVMLEFSNGHTEMVPETIQPSDQTFVNVNNIIANHPGTCDTSPCQPTQDVSADISSSSNFIAQREMFFHYNHVGNGRTLVATGGTDVIGQSVPVSSYSFAEGYTNVGYDEWLTLQNPSSATETVTLKIVNEDGRSFSQGYTLLAHSRFTIGITALVLQNLIVPNDTFKGYEVSLTTQAGSSALFMVERPMYWNTGSSGTQGGSDVIGYDGG